MNPLLLYLASGESLYPGTALLLLLLILSPRLRNPWLLRLRNFCAWIALALMTFAGPPLSAWWVGSFLAAFVAWFIACNFRFPTTRIRKIQPLTAIVVAALALFLAVLEWPHRSMPPLHAPIAGRLAVIGDSLSAGIETARLRPWPAEFETLTGVPVHNLAQAGAQVADGPAMAKRLTPDDRLVLIELGGNDLIANLPAADFERGLHATLTAITAPGTPQRTLLMFELPLLPHKVAYGRIQRRLAAQYGIILIPRRHLTAVLGSADATSDGLHLAPAGARRMAELLAEKLSPILKKSP